MNKSYLLYTYYLYASRLFSKKLLSVVKLAQKMAKEWKNLRPKFFSQNCKSQSPKQCTQNHTGASSPISMPHWKPGIRKIPGGPPCHEEILRTYIGKIITFINYESVLYFIWWRWLSCKTNHFSLFSIWRKIWTKRYINKM